MDTDTSALARIIASIESGGNQYALRFEPTVYVHYQTANETETSLIEHICAENICTTATALVIAATSFGLYQIMGENLYGARWHSGMIGAYLGNHLAQTRSFGDFLTARQLPTSWEAMKADDAQIAHFAERYNGSIAYAARMKEAATKLGL